ncbi:MAG: beta strand repeat-containing protein [Anaerolineae bacterium]|jgi:predicted outer membrane repeat protein
MNSLRRLAPFSQARPIRRVRLTAGTEVLSLATALIIILALAIPSLAQTGPSSVEGVTVICVDKDATGAETGESWEDAFTTLHDALEVAVGAEIWVAEGVYYPDEGTGQVNGDRTATFRLKQGIAIYGGFNGTENLREQRDWVNNVTVLSGDLDKNDVTDAKDVVANPGDIVGADNSYHVVVAEDVMLSAELNGFVITGGLADSTTEAAHHKGAGLYIRNAAPTLANLIIRGNKADGELLGSPAGDGGGLYNESGGPQFTNITLRNNYARIAGGGFYTTDSGGGFANLTLQENQAGVTGGGMCVTTTLGHTLSNLTITGNSAGEYGGGLYVESGVQSTISNSTLTANTAVQGGGLYVSSSVLRLNSVDLIVNEASEFGGGMFAQLGQYWLTTVTFTSNEADTAGGGLYADRNEGSLTGTTFTGNTSVLGAGMYVDDQELSYASLTMTSGVFVNNVATEDGGGLYVVDSPQGTLSSVSFLYNEATTGNGGGMVLTNSETYSLSNCEFSGNQATSGGGMYVDSSDLTLTQVTFAANHAELASADNSIGGGGLYLVSSSDATLSRATFRENKAANGGGMYIDDSNPTLTNVAFVSNQAGDGTTGSGGGLWNDEGSPALVDVLFSGNAATQIGGGMRSGGAGSNVVLTNLTFSGNSAGGSGGGLHTTSPNMTIHNTVIWNNQDASGIGTADSSIWDDPDAVIDHSLIQGQIPPGLGNLDGTNPANDALFVVPVDPSTAPATGGILSVKYGSPIIDVGDNTAVPTGVTLDLAGKPRIYNSIVDLGAYEFPLACPPPETTRLYVDHTANGTNTGTSWLNALKALRDAFTLADNCAGIGEIWVAEGVHRPDVGTGLVPDSRTETYQLIDGVTVYGGFEGTETLLQERNWDNNVTVLSGDVDSNDDATGGIVNTPGDISGANSYHVVVANGVGNTAVLDGFTITAGQANGSAANPEGRGGGIYNDAGSPTLSNLTFIGNIAGNGGGLANLNGDAPLTNAFFKNNMAVSSGGGIFNEASSPTLSDLVFTGNYAGTGSGLANLSGSNPQLTGVQFTSNRAGTSGGGIYNQASSPTLTDVQFTSNTAGSSGGGICNQASSPMLTDAILSGNSAPNGAAIYNDTSNPSLVNALLSGNYASTNGAAFYNTASSPSLVNVTVSGNRAGGTGGGMFNAANSDPSMQNSILWNNQDASGAGTASATILNDDLDSKPTIDYSLVQALSSIYHTGSNNLDENPWFTTPVDPSTAPTTAGDLTLGIFSPAKDAGDNAANATLTDLAGGLRVINTVIDMGPYEAPYVPVYSSYLPVVLRSSP